MEFPIVNLSIDKLRYDFDQTIGRGRDYSGFDKAFLSLEKSLPEVPKDLLHFKNKYFPRLLNVYNSIKEEGLKNPLIVLQVGELYRVRVGNQRLCSARALGLKEIPCQITPDKPKTVQDVTKYEYIEGCEERRRPT